MSSTVFGSFSPDLSMEIVHESSEATLKTAVPKESLGDSSSFSSTDLVAAALGSCILSTIGIVARKKGLDLTGSTMRVMKETEPNPFRIAKLDVLIRLPSALEQKERERLEAYGAACPVKRALNSEVIVTVTYAYDV